MLYYIPIKLRAKKNARTKIVRAHSINQLQ